jgi:hypothetical protein
MTLTPSMLVVIGTSQARFTPLPADPPISGPVWSYLVPAALLLIAFLGTLLLYRKFTRGEGQSSD